MNEGGRGSWDFRDWLYDIKLGPEGDIYATGFLLQRPLSRHGTFGTGPVWSTAAAGRYTNPGETRPLSLEVFPNPAYEQVTFQVGLPEETEAEVSLYDLAGRHITTLQQIWPAGRQRLSWRPQNLAAGLYLYRVRLGSQHYSGKLVWRGGS